ncbi:MAG: hypothetical protein KA354_11400 [Phycisphaerae bacterium]|nr:hypothetical protein [Phycisphaerae bacterium]
MLWIVVLLLTSVATVEQTAAQCRVGELGGLKGLIGFWNFDEEEGGRNQVLGRR